MSKSLLVLSLITLLAVTNCNEVAEVIDQDSLVVKELVDRMDELEQRLSAEGGNLTPEDLAELVQDVEVIQTDLKKAEQEAGLTETKSFPDESESGIKTDLEGGNSVLKSLTDDDSIEEDTDDEESEEEEEVQEEDDNAGNEKDAKTQDDPYTGSGYLNTPASEKGFLSEDLSQKKNKETLEAKTVDTKNSEKSELHVVDDLDEEYDGSGFTSIFIFILLAVAVYAIVYYRKKLQASNFISERQGASAAELRNLAE
mmetsp:Transcript_64003/g.73443  ORF Transcript_64003/g.73443 Transcript_64003/m.73443 type:complete len:256 (-) Transcript_64003:1661-2428(-)